MINYKDYYIGRTVYFVQYLKEPNPNLLKLVVIFGDIQEVNKDTIKIGTEVLDYEDVYLTDDACRLRIEQDYKYRIEMLEKVILELKSRING